MSRVAFTLFSASLQFPKCRNFPHSRNLGCTLKEQIHLTLRSEEVFAELASSDFSQVSVESIFRHNIWVRLDPPPWQPDICILLDTPKRSTKVRCQIPPLPACTGQKVIQMTTFAQINLGKLSKVAAATGPAQKLRICPCLVCTAREPVFSTSEIWKPESSGKVTGELSFVFVIHNDFNHIWGEGFYRLVFGCTTSISGTFACFVLTWHPKQVCQLHMTSRFVTGTRITQTVFMVFKHQKLQISCPYIHAFCHKFMSISLCSPL